MSENVMYVSTNWACPFMRPGWPRECHAPGGPRQCQRQYWGADPPPETCPLRKGPVIVRMKEAEHE